jgi:hypothetical protein
MSNIEKKRVTPVVTIEFASGPIVLDTGKVSIDMRDALAREVGRIRAKDSTFFQYPMDEGQTLEDWQETVGEEADAQWAIRKEGESVEDHVIRINSPKTSVTDLALAVMNSFHKMLTGDKDAHQIERKEFGFSHWKSVKEKLHFFCVEADVWVPEFAPNSHKSK